MVQYVLVSLFLLFKCQRVFFKLSPETKQFALKFLCTFCVLCDLQIKKFILSVRIPGCVNDVFVQRTVVFFG